MISKSYLLLAVGVAGLALFSARGRQSRTLKGDGDKEKEQKNLTGWERTNDKLPSTATPSTGSSSFPSSASTW
ncbi:MAG: hypothetical protein ABI606_17025 [Rhodoferax sp.]